MKNRIFIRIFWMLACLSGGIGNTVSAQRSEPDNRPLAQRSWTAVADGMPAEWYATAEARQVAEQVLLYQRPSGGWPKNLAMHQPMTDAVREGLSTGAPGYEATLDNNATTTEMKFMARMYEATREPRYRTSFEKGLDYVLEAQYDNGGWPQFYPLREGYYTHITFNDNATANILRLLKDIFDENPLYGFVATPQVKARAQRAFDKGLECILNCQIVVDGGPTVWCAQHDETTLEPAKARAYELPSFSGSESVGLILLLMEIERPSPRVVAAIEGAVRWLDEHRIEGIRLEQQMPDGTRDRHVVADPNAPSIWARFYDLETARPIFVGRDGVKRAALADIEYERRNGYSYYSSEPHKVFEAYSAWKSRR